MNICMRLVFFKQQTRPYNVAKGVEVGADMFHSGSQDVGRNNGGRQHLLIEAVFFKLMVSLLFWHFDRG